MTSAWSACESTVIPLFPQPPYHTKCGLIGIYIGGWGAQPGNLNGSCVRDPVAGALELD